MIWLLAIPLIGLLWMLVVESILVRYRVPRSHLGRWSTALLWPLSMWYWFKVFVLRDLTFR